MILNVMLILNMLLIFHYGNGNLVEKITEKKFKKIFFQEKMYQKHCSLQSSKRLYCEHHNEP